MGINIFLFVHFYLFYDKGPQFEYTRELLGVSSERKKKMILQIILQEKIVYAYFMTSEVRVSCSKREISRVEVLKVNVILFLSVCIALGQSSSCCTQLQLHADSSASMPQPALSSPWLFHGELLNTCTFVFEI